jgi:hypothetical protein
VYFFGLKSPLTRTFQLLPIYTPVDIDHYIRQSSSKPHIFKTADEAFLRLMSNKRDQVRLEFIFFSFRVLCT